jgi:hypothetical protein
MNLQQSPSDIAFRGEVRWFFENEYPQDILAKVRNGQELEKADHVRSQIALQKRGWFAATWPKQFGGTGWTARERFIFDEELEHANAPAIIAMGVIYLGPLVCQYGTSWQKENWLPKTLNSEIFWAQGYSETGSGSDLASLSMRGVRDGDEYVVNGHKIWTTQAHWADWIFCLIRTSNEARKQEGISIVCIPMNAPGVAVHPIVGIDGSHHLNKVTFDNVRVPVEYRIGEEGRGWSLAKFVLNNERLSYAHIARKRTDVRLLKALARRIFGDGDDEGFAQKIAAYEVALDSLEISVLRILTGAADGSATTSRAKIEATEGAQRLTELFVELCGYSAFPMLPRTADDWSEGLGENIHSSVPVMASYLFTRAQSIYGGSNEIQKDIIWKGIG